jgi:hypothetical protein
MGCSMYGRALIPNFIKKKNGCQPHFPDLFTDAIYRSAPELAAQWLHKLRRHLQRSNVLSCWRKQRDILNTSPTARFLETSVPNFEETGPHHNSGGHNLCSSSLVPRILTHRSVSLLRHLQSLSHSISWTQKVHFRNHKSPPVVPESLSKSGSARKRTWNSWYVARTLTTRPQRRSVSELHNIIITSWVQTRTVRNFRNVLCKLDGLCGLVVRVLGYRSGGPGSILGTTRKKE